MSLNSQLLQVQIIYPGKNTFHAAALVYSAPDRHFITTAIVQLCEPIREEHGNTIKTLNKGPDSTCKLLTTWATGTAQDEVHNVLQQLGKLSVLDNCSICLAFPSAPNEDQVQVII
jgi:hypothetical protein